MALVTGSAYAGLSDRNGAPVIAGLFAGEALKAGAPCYIKSDGKVYECLATSGSATSMPHGFTPRQTAVDEPVSLYGEGSIFQYSSGLTPGAKLYISDSDAGLFENAATLGDKVGVVVCIDANNFIVVRADGRSESVAGGA